jgi:hypothetical protein
LWWTKLRWKNVFFSWHIRLPLSASLYQQSVNMNIHASTALLLSEGQMGEALGAFRQK